MSKKATSPAWTLPLTWAGLGFPPEAGNWSHYRPFDDEVTRLADDITKLLGEPDFKPDFESRSIVLPHLGEESRVASPDWTKTSP
jgi:hypothetical protein